MGFYRFFGVVFLGHQVCEQKSALIECPWKHSRYLATALRFRQAHREKNKKIYYTKHKSKSKRRLFVTGGRHLSESGEYTPQFCQCVIDIWKAASCKTSRSWTKKVTNRKQLWENCFGTSNVRQEKGCGYSWFQFSTWGLQVTTWLVMLHGHHRSYPYQEPTSVLDGIDRTLATLANTLAVL